VFNTSYKFSLIGADKNNPLKPELVCKTIYKFSTEKGNAYLVEVYEHGQKVFIIKFYLREHKNQPTKFHALTNLREWGGVLRTVVDICIHTHSTNENASFAFIGVPKLDEQSEPHKSNNQRFRGYKRMTETFMGTATFNHIESEEANAYLLLNKGNGNAESVIQMLTNIYQDIGDLLSP
jgi:hypothetical protein